jgi:hypothetical protein
MIAKDEPPTLFTVWGTPVKISPLVMVNVLGLWAGLSWLSGRRQPKRSWSTRLLVGALSTLALLVADIGHAMAHIVSARYAGAPMDEILVSEGMPRTIYHDNDVSPQAHRLRALGGPVFSAMGLLTSLLLRQRAPSGSTTREIVDWSCIGHGLILGGSLAPLTVVDGGSILKWTLVEQGKSPEEADATVKRASLALGAAATTAGVALATKRRWLPALGLLVAGAVAIGAALDRFR